MRGRHRADNGLVNIADVAGKHDGLAYAVLVQFQGDAGIDYILITHSHIDHSGRVPMLIKQGFTGQIWTTRLTARLLEIMLIDSAYIQMSDAGDGLLISV